MVNGKKIAVLAGFGLAAFLGLNQGAGWAGIPVERDQHSSKASIVEVGNQVPIILARGGKGGGGGGNSSGSGGGYGAQDGTGSAPRPQDGTGYGAKKGSGSGDCDGSGPKGKGRKNQTN